MTQVAYRYGVSIPGKLLLRLSRIYELLKAPTEDYRQAIDDIEEAFSWYETLFPGIRLHRYCGMEAKGWNLGCSGDLIKFAMSDRDNVFSALYDDLVRPRILAGNYDALGITLVCDDQLLATTTLALKLTKEVTRPRLVLGGPLASMLANRSPRSSFLGLFDYVYVGAATDKVLDAFAPGAVHAELARNSQCWPMPDWNNKELDSYLSPEPVIPIHSTSGCPFSCNFCSSPAVAELLDGVRFRQRKADEIAQEMCNHANDGYRYFLLVGEMMTFAHALDVARAIRCLGIGGQVNWYFWSRTAPVPSLELLRELRLQGCRRICFGLETTDEKALSLADKQTVPKDSAETLRRVVAADIQPHLFLMTGLPGQEPHVADAGLLALLKELRERGAYGITATVSPFEPETWAPWNAHPIGLYQIDNRRFDLQISLPATDAAEDHAHQLRCALDKDLETQPFLGRFGNAHQLVFLDRIQRNSQHYASA
jgi:hypothetical protein